jgi:hypothetical protein
LTKTPKRCEKCKRTAKKSSRFCWQHSSTGGRPVTTFSKSVKKRNIFTLIDEAKRAENRGKLFDMTEDIASIQAILDSHRENVMNAYNNIELAKSYRDKSGGKKGAGVPPGFMPAMTDVQALNHLVAITDVAAAEAVERLVEKKSAMIERYYKTEKNKAETYTINQMGILVAYVAAVIRAEILDSDLRKRIQARLEMVPFDNILKGDVIEPDKVIVAQVLPDPDAPPVLTPLDAPDQAQADDPSQLL